MVTDRLASVSRVVHVLLKNKADFPLRSEARVAVNTGSPGARVPGRQDFPSASVQMGQFISVDISYN